MTEFELKALTDVEIKSASRGQVTAVFATFGEVDADGDITFPGAFDDNEWVPISQWGHASHLPGRPPAGKGRIRSTATEALLDGQFFLGTEHGRSTFDVVAQLAESGLGQWSYGYDVLNAPETVLVGGRKARALRKLLVTEVSPVLRGAGVATRTLVAKSNDDAARELARMVRRQWQEREREEMRGIRDRAEVAAIRGTLR